MSTVTVAPRFNVTLETKDGLYVIKINGYDVATVEASADGKDAYININDGNMEQTPHEGSSFWFRPGAAYDA